MARPAPRWDVEVHPELLTTHHWWTLCALTELERRGEVRVRFRTLRSRPHRASARMIVRDAALRTERSVAFDLHDEVGISEEETRWADVLFKRSFLAASAADEGVVRPLGLTIGLRTPGMLSRAAREQTALLAASARRRPLANSRLLAGSFRASAELSWTSLTGRARAPVPEPISFYESLAPARIGTPKVTFLVRAWDPRGIREPSASDFAGRTNERAQIIRALRAHFGETFIGGFVPSAYVASHYPDCVAQVSTHRRDFLMLAACSGIGVSTRGLADSNPWKLAEYLAMGVAVATEPLQHLIPRPLEPGTNGLFFDDIAECIDACERLLSDRDLLDHVRASNVRYWREEVRPDQLLRSRFVEAGSL